MSNEKFYATGRRKSSSARVWVTQGTGKFSVNGMSLASYFKRQVLQMIINQPLDVCDAKDRFDVVATVKGGGHSGQAGAISHGLSHALTRYDDSLRGALKKSGYLTRDSRCVERKKYGLAGARKKYQYSKR